MSRIAMRRAPRRPAVPPAGRSFIRARDVSVDIDDRTILKHIDLDIVAGEVLALVGPNGAGKSTLLAAITGDLRPTGGTVVLDGSPLASWSSRELAMRRAVLLQRIDVSFPFTVLEVVQMGRAPWQRTLDEDHDEMVVAGAMSRTETEGFAVRSYTSLSGGERGRAAFARVLAQSSTALLLDEPTAAMDIRHQEMVLRLAREYAATGCAVVIVVHNLDLAAAYADRVALLSQGEIDSCGAPGEVLTAERLSRVYDYPIEIIRHPVTDASIIVPVRTQPPTGHERTRT